jgi:hypothetical protein
VAADPIHVALRVAEALESCDIRYVLGGSLASSISGEPRSTLDVDLVVEMAENHVGPFIAELGEDFYADADALRRAIETRSSANVVHYSSSTKVDLFVAGGSPIDERQLARRRRVLVATEPDRYLYAYTPEDILLQKLRWYRLSEETSDRQWRDVIGIVRVQATDLDLEYLRESALLLGVTDLLERALGSDS